MHYTYRYRLKPTDAHHKQLDYWRDTCRQLYNHALNEFSEIPNSERTLNQRVRQVRDQLPDLKDWGDDLNDLYSTVTQAAVMRIEDSVSALSQLKKPATTLAVSTGKPPASPAASLTYREASSSIVRRSDCTFPVEARGYSSSATSRGS
ncbi:MAG: helix-turn-helix domain protein [halophilic archaeon J07HX5]|nr:MAG: helix-turn-helix domain protein [halophilic archaeon J07HX5]